MPMESYAGAKKPGLHVVTENGVQTGGFSALQVSEYLTRHLDTQTRLCDALERFADNLPDNVSADDCLAIAQSVFPTVHRAHQFEENILFPMLQRKCARQQGLAQTLDRLHGEHWEDESYAEEIAQGLREFACDRNPRDAETIAYMVRGFFEGLRRHLAFEREHILPMLEAGEQAKNG